MHSENEREQTRQRAQSCRQFWIIRGTHHNTLDSQRQRTDSRRLAVPQSHDECVRHPSTTSTRIRIMLTIMTAAVGARGSQCRSRGGTCKAQRPRKLYVDPTRPRCFSVYVPGSAVEEDWGTCQLALILDGQLHIRTYSSEHMNARSRTWGRVIPRLKAMTARSPVRARPRRSFVRSVEGRLSPGQEAGTTRTTPSAKCQVPNTLSRRPSSHTREDSSSEHIRMPAPDAAGEAGEAALEKIEARRHRDAGKRTKQYICIQYEWRTWLWAGDGDLGLGCRHG